MYAKVMTIGGAAMALALGFAGISVAPASAWPGYVDYPAQEFRYNYHSYAHKAAVGGDAGGPHGVGSETDFFRNIQNLSGYEFLSYGPGQGKAIKNNAGSVYNLSGQYVDVFFHSYGYYGCWCGTHDRVGWAGHDLSVTYNENASHHATTINSY